MSDNEETNDPRVKWVPLNELRMEEGAEEMLKADAAKPYLRAISALLQKKEDDPAFEELRLLPLEKRYVWRVASALKWAFVDFDHDSVLLDRQMMPPDDLKKVIELLSHRPLQFCLFLKTLIGEDAMVAAMVSAIRNAKSIGS